LTGESIGQGGIVRLAAAGAGRPVSRSRQDDVRAQLLPYRRPDQEAYPRHPGAPRHAAVTLRNSPCRRVSANSDRLQDICGSQGDSMRASSHFELWLSPSKRHRQVRNKRMADREQAAGLNEARRGAAVLLEVLRTEGCLYTHCHVNPSWAP
jgi:hypothetical protein